MFTYKVALLGRIAGLVAEQLSLNLGHAEPDQAQLHTSVLQNLSRRPHAACLQFGPMHSSKVQSMPGHGAGKRSLKNVSVVG